MQLHPDVSFCRIDDQFVFLDLARDRYFCLGRDLAADFAALLDGEGSADGIARLEAQGLVVAKDGRRLAPCPTDLTRPSILDLPVSSPSLARVASLAWGFARMRRLLRRHGLARPVAVLVEARRIALPEVDDRDLIETAMAYERLSLIRGAHDLCLPHALALAIHLARRGYSAQVVFGVQLQPFSAHCWVECGDRLVNDRFDRTRLYTPICRL